MTTKYLVLGGLCGVAMFFNTACSNAKFTHKSSNNNANIAGNQKLPAVAAGPDEAPAPRHTWGNAISPYVN